MNHLVKKFFACFTLGIFFFSIPSVALAQGLSRAPIFDGAERHNPVVGEDGMVVAQEWQAAEIGAEILRAGGNAVDAAVATGFALAVTLPRAGNIGGGGFMLVHLADEDKTIAIDYREMAPLASTRDMFLDENGNPDPRKSRFDYTSSGVPGTVAGFLYVLEKYGTMTPAEVLAPAIRLAEEGMTVSYYLSEGLKAARSMMLRSPVSRDIFMRPDGSPLEAGDWLIQADLAATLKDIATYGKDGFYGGRVADLIVADMQANGGLITHEDLANYHAVEREAAHGVYRGYEIYSMSPPSSGGLHIVQMLNMLENYNLAEMGAGSADAYHVMAEAMRRAYADRSEHLGDPAFWDVPVEWLTSKTYAKDLARGIDLERATPSAEIGPGDPGAYESPQTTHFSVVDNEGNVVSNTYTLNFSYGNGHTIAGAGFLLNNQMDDFSAKPGTPNAFGLLGGEANAVEAGKRPLSSMSPTIVLRAGQPFLAVGTPGGSTIINSVLQVIVNVIDFGMNVAEAAAFPRIHHQWYPDILMVERGISPDTLRLLSGKGHMLQTSNAMGSIQAIMIQNGVMQGAADPRRPNAAAVGLFPGEVRNPK